MKVTNYHTHTVFCDGNNTPEEMVLAAIEAGVSDIGFSAHAAWPFASEWHLAPQKYIEYLAEISRLKIQYADRIRIRSGFEADFIPGITMPDYTLYAQFKPDFLIGSVHYVVSDNKHTRAFPWAVDASTGVVADGIAKCFNGDGRRAVCAYWQAIRDMVSSSAFDIVGHLDVIRKRNGELRFFNETDNWYRRELQETVRVIARSGKIVELNTGGIARKAIDDLYPSKELLALLYHNDVPITFSSDTHSTADILCAYNRALDAAHQAGYQTMSYLTDSGEWEQQPF